MLKAGDKAFPFSLSDKDGNTVSLNDFKGSKLIVYFYPKDNTPGCTTQACAFRDAFDIYKEHGIPVIGISKDSQKSHQGFSEKHELPFTLLSDPQMKAIEGFGVWKEKTMFGKTAMGVARATFIIDENGVIEKVYEKASPKTNATEILEYLNIPNA